MLKILRICDCGRELVKIENQKDNEFNSHHLLESAKITWRTYKCPKELNAHFLVRPFIIHTTLHILGGKEES